MKSKSLLVVALVLFTILGGLVSLFYFNDDLCCQYDFCSNLRDVCIEDDEEKGFILSEKGERIYLDNINEGEELTTGSKINGRVTGTWFFEASFPVRVEDFAGNEITTLLANATDDWMTDQLVPFTIVLDVELEERTDIILYFQKNNPSDKRELDDFATLRLSILPTLMERLSVNIYLSSEEIIDAGDCSTVIPVTREIFRTNEIERAALEELLKGSIESEDREGYFTNINEGVVIQSFEIVNREARVDFDNTLEEGVGGSCLVTAIRAQIEDTLLQFDNIDSVIISINGRVEDILQP